jgi:hypothetical protein
LQAFRSPCCTTASVASVSDNTHAQVVSVSFAILSLLLQRQQLSLSLSAQCQPLFGGDHGPVAWAQRRLVQAAVLPARFFSFPFLFFFARAFVAVVLTKTLFRIDNSKTLVGYSSNGQLLIYFIINLAKTLWLPFVQEETNSKLSLLFVFLLLVFFVAFYIVWMCYYYYIV